MYSQKVIERFRNPKFVGEIKNPDAVGEVGNPRCGDILRVFLKIEKDTIKDIKFQTFGCIAAISASEALCELAQGKKLSEALKISHNDITNRLDGLPPVKIHCSVLGAEALKKAIKSYKKK